jgi:WD40 repeat protein
MPPEQARGELSLVDECSDAYSLGAVLYELLTGKRPFTGTRASDVLQKVLRDVPEPVRTLEPDTPPELAAICAKAMARDRDRRYANARELAEETQRFLSGALVGAYHYSPAEHLRRLIARHKVLFSVAAAFTVLLVVVSLAYTWSLSRKNVELAASRAEEHAQRLDAEAAREVAVEAQDEAERNAYLAQIRLAGEYADSRNHDAARETLWETPSRLRNWEWGYLLNRCNQDLFTLEGCRLVRYSPDGKHLATLSLAESPRVWNADDGSLVATMESLPLRYLALAYSPDGSKIAAGAVNGAVMVWDAQSGKVNHALKTPSGSAADVQFSPDGQFIYSISTDGGIIRWNAESGESTATAQTEGNVLQRSVQVSPDGAYVLASLDRDRYIVLNAGTLETRWSFEGVTPSFCPSANTILLARGTEALRSETSTGELLSAAFDHGAKVLRARGDGQGRRIVTIGADSTAKIWNVAAGTVESVIALDDETTDAVFSPSGNPLLTYGSNGAIQLWDSTSGAPLASFDGHSASVRSAEFSRDARTFATESRDDTVKVWHVSGPIGKRTLYRSPEALNALSIDRASERIALVSLTGRCIVVDLQTGAKAAEFGPVLPHLDAAIALQPNADRAVMLADDFCPMVYDFREHRIVTPYFGHGGIVGFLSFSPDGQYVASCGEDTTAHIWDPETGETRVVFEGHDDTVYSVVFSPGGESLLTASGDTTARRWNASTGAELTTYQGHTDIVTFAQFSADAQRVVTGAADGTARVWDAESGRELLVLGGNQPDVGAAVFSADGSRIFTGGTDGLVKVWDASTGAQLDAYTDHSGMVRTLELGPEDNQILSASLDGAAFLWEAAPLYGPGNANRTDLESRDDYNRYRREAYASRQTALIEAASLETRVMVSTDAFREKLARLATLARSQGQTAAPDSLGDGVLIAGDADGKAFSMLGLSPDDRIIGIGETMRADSGNLADALEVAVGAPMPVILHIEGKRTRQIRLMPIDVHSEHREVVTSKDAATKLLKRLQDLLVANETMLEDVRRRNALARGEIQGPTEPILGFWLVASPGTGDAGDLPDLGLAYWDRIIAINGHNVHSIAEVIDEIAGTLDNESAEALRSYSFEVERGEFRRVTITLLTE